MTPRQLKTLTKLSSYRVFSAIELTDEEINTIRSLIRHKLVIDYSDLDLAPIQESSKRRRPTPINLRLWGVSPLGKAILQQEGRTTQVTKRPQPYLIGLENLSKFSKPGRDNSNE